MPFGAVQQSRRECPTMAVRRRPTTVFRVQEPPCAGLRSGRPSELDLRIGEAHGRAGVVGGHFGEDAAPIAQFHGAALICCS